MKTSKSIKVKFFTDISPELPGILLEWDGKKILVDPGRNEQQLQASQLLPQFDIPNLDAIVLTHYHGDHVNLVDEILKSEEFRGRIICHRATADIVQTYYDDIDQQFKERFVRLNYCENFNLYGDDSLTLFNAGHVLGSSIVYFKFQDKIIAITGDLGADCLPIVQKPTTEFPTGSIDLLIMDAKQAEKLRDVDDSLGDVIYKKLRDCFLFDDGNVLIYAPLVQIPMLLYCLNYIFNNEKYSDIHNKIAKVYLDRQQKLLKLLKIFDDYKFLFDTHEVEHVTQDKHPFSFKKLVKLLPTNYKLRRSIIITPNRNEFVRFFKVFKQSEKNDVLLLNTNIHFALKADIGLIDEQCNIQIKRLPFLHYHPDQSELIDWYKTIRATVGVNRVVFYHYYRNSKIEKMKRIIKKEVGGNIYLAHRLNHSSITI